MKVGLLPLYLELYDETTSFMRPRIEAFRDTIAKKLSDLGLEIVDVPICRLADEFFTAVQQIESEGGSAIITLHMAYSPSLESIDALAKTKLPIVVLDTTETYAFDPSVGAEEILYNHGIHGVQDMCNLLIRRGKGFEIFAGHYEHSDVLTRVVNYCRGVEIANNFRNARVGLVGEPFKGMGDFQVPFAELYKDFGLEVIPYDFDAASRRIAAISATEIAQERQEDEGLFEWDPSVTDEIYERTTRVCLALRQWMEEQKVNGLSVNFLATEGSPAGLPVMPFTECSKAMTRGIGYAGEGDVLTAALCGAVLSTFSETSFTEIFCPDWKGESLFLSHMGEFNYNVCAGKPRLTEKDFPFTTAENPTVAYGTLKSGKAVYINLLPNGSGKYTLILAKGEVLPVKGENKFAESVNGWFKPDKPLTEFLEEFSRAGGTHHSVISHDDCFDALVSFASVMGFEIVII